MDVDSDKESCPSNKQLSTTIEHEIEVKYDPTRSTLEVDKHAGKAGQNLSSYREHFRAIFAIAGPIMLCEFFQNTLPLIDIVFVARLGKDELASAALATVWFNLWNTTMIGVLTAIDTLLAQSFGADEYKAFAMWTGTSLFIVFVLTFFIAGLTALCEPFLVLLGQDPELSRAAGNFSFRLIPGLFPYFAFKVLVKYLQTQNILLPGVMIGLIANLLNALWNWLLIYKLDMGLNGAPWATTLTRYFEFILIALYLYARKDTLLAPTWPSFSFNHGLDRRNLRSFSKLAIPGALSLSAEAWSFEVTTILAGLIGTYDLDAHAITLSICTFIFLSFPFAIGIASCIRIGQLIGEGDFDNAKRSCVLSFFLAVVVQLVLIAILLPLHSIIGRAFSDNENISNLVSSLILLSGLFMMGDAVHVTVCGALRGLGHHKKVLFLNFAGFWILGVPIGALLAFVGDIGVRGLWWGMSIGIYASSIVGIILLKKTDWHLASEKAKLRMSFVIT